MQAKLIIRTLLPGGPLYAVRPRHVSSGGEVDTTLSFRLLEGLGDGSHRRQLASGRYGSLSRGGLLGLGRFALSASLLLVHDDAHVLLLSQRLLSAHLLDLLLGDVADGRKLRRRRTGGAIAGYAVRVIVGKDGLGKKLQILVGNVGADAGSVMVVGQGISPWPTGECAAGIELGRRVVGSSSRWDFHRRCGAVRPV